MGASARPIPVDELDALIASRQKALGQTPSVAVPATAAPADDLDNLIASRQQALGGAQPGALARGGALLANTIAQTVSHPIKTAESVASSLAGSFKTAGGYLGQRAAELTLPPDVRAMAEADPSRINGKDAAIAGAQVGTLLLPGVGRGAAGLLESVLPRAIARTASTLGAGAVAGAAFNPNDPGAGAIAGAGLGLAGEAGASAAKRAGGVLIDARGARPMETQTIKVGPVSLGTIEGVRDRATRVNSEIVARSPSTDGMSPFSEKPVTPMDVLGTSGVRAVRGLKTSSPAAESVVRGAFDDRSGGAVDRVIQHGLEATGLASRENGLQVVDDMIAQRAEHGNENYQPIFAKYTQPLDNPTFAEIAKTPTGQQVLKRAGVLAADRGDAIGSVSDPMSAPAGIAPEDWANMQQLAKERGISLPMDPNSARIAPTLKQAHYVKLAFDDLLNSAPEPGSGGLGPNRAAAVRALKNRWVAAMDTEAPEYGAARKQYADESDLVRGADLGRSLWKLHPAEAEKAFNDLPEAAQDVFRRTGFDARAERVENGPADNERGVSKPRDVRRMQLLFPTADAFGQFKQGLSDEAQLHANEQGVIGGSNTADKLADIANMAGVTLPDLARAAATGRWHRLVGQVAANVTRKMTTQGADAVSAERARQLTAGANGDLAARNDALERLGLISRQPPPRTATASTGSGPVIYNADRLAAGTTPSANAAAIGGGPVPPNRRVPFTTPTAGDVQQGAAVPVAGPLPKDHRLGGLVRPPATGGSVQQGPAMPIPQPVPLSRRLRSAGPSPVPTSGDSPLGPAIPTGGQQLEEAVQSALINLYTRNPKWAVSLSASDQARLAAEIRARFADGR